jgi:RNA polymerase sigma factor (sigma-70 family)
MSSSFPFPGAEGLQRERAFAKLFAEHGPMVFAVCRRILPRREDAEDACQAAFLVLARNGPALRDETRLAAWLHRVATRCAWKLHRKISAHARLEAPLETIGEPSAAPALDDGWHAMIDSELDRLPNRYRVAIVLCYLEGRSYGAAAAELGLTHAGLKTRLERGRSLLRERLLRRGFKGAVAVFAMEALCGGPAPAAAQLGLRVPSASAIAVSRAVRFQLAASAAATKLLPLAACIVAVLMIFPSSRTSAEPTAAVPRSSPANRGSVTGTSTPSNAFANRGANVPTDYPYVIAWKKGREEFAAGNEIAIAEIRGTKPNFELGSRYIVRGRYRLTSAPRGKLAFYITASGVDGFSSGEEPEQSCELKSGEGEFTLSRYFDCMGDPHISFYDEKGSNVGGIYFSDGTQPKSQPLQAEDEPPQTDEKPLQAAIEMRRQPGGFDQDVMQLKFRADEGDRTAALELAERELNRARPDLIQAYRWLYVAGETARAAETLAALSPEQRTEAERVTTAYVQRPTAPKPQ